MTAMEAPGLSSIINALVTLTIVAGSTAALVPEASSTQDPHRQDPPLSSSSSGKQDCQNLDAASKCYKLIPHAQWPNVYGHLSQEQATAELEETLRKFGHPGQDLVSFLCTLYFPPCSVGTLSLGEAVVTRALTPLPCRGMCEQALALTLSSTQGQHHGPWPVRCQSLPTDRCYYLDEQGRMAFTHSTLSTLPVNTDKIINSNNNNNSNNNKASGESGGASTSPSSGVSKSSDEEVPQFTSLEAELGDDESYDVEVVSLSSSQKAIRRYDIIDLGDPDLFHGWADVQGLGAANDYCRVVGKANRRFLSCNLAGNWGVGHHYVSKLGFDVGHPGTWFMRDMDGDSKDDYCRCVGPPSDSKVTCMKAGPKGFYGSTTQTGSQHTFSLPFSSGCHDKQVNAMFGE